MVELVIKIDDNLYTRLFDNGTDFYDTDDILAMAKAIRKGTVLPKGHGRLIDADELKKHKYHDNKRFENVVAVAQIDWADTIIEADKEKSDPWEKWLYPNRKENEK